MSQHFPRTSVFTGIAHNSMSLTYHNTVHLPVNKRKTMSKLDIPLSSFLTEITPAGKQRANLSARGPTTGLSKVISGRSR